MKLLVAYLATPGGEDAVKLGAALAGTLDVPLDITTVIPPDDPSPDDDVFAEILDETAHGWLRDAAALVPPGIDVHTYLTVADHAADGLITKANELGSTVLIVGGSGGGLVGRHSLGTVVNDLLHSSPIPVALAPRGYSHLGPDSVHGFTAAIGSRPGTEHLLDVAFELSGRGRVPLRLLSLVSADDQPNRRTGDDDQSATDRAVDLAQKSLDAAHARLPEKVAVRSELAKGASIGDAVATVEWRDGDIIVVGSSRLAAPQKLFLGTTAAKMLRVLAVPMIVVPSRADGPTAADH